MSVAYWQIVRVLWRSDTIPGHAELACATTTVSGEHAVSSGMRKY
jgi:hypothetical protein